jgi:selenocysteine lyase/cysteine desulfurase
MVDYFEKFRKNIIGNNIEFETPYGIKRLIYADWTASGRLYGPIEDKLKNEIEPYVGNTHTETSLTGTVMTLAYHEAKNIIKQHVNAGDNDVLICAESGMTGVINKFQRILGIKLHEKFRDKIKIPEEDRPVIFITSMEHHSNQTSWLETIGDVVIIGLDDEGLTDLEHFKRLIDKYKNRKMKIAAITSCSNVTGIMTNYHEMAKIIHKAGGYCFVDFAASAPYIDIDMHPADEDAHLDAIFFSPHKFLGGPGSSGVLIFNRELYKNEVPDNPGGGTVDWTNPWGEHKFVSDIEAREDGGTPPFLQTIRIALTIQLKEEMGTDNIARREKQIVKMVFEQLSGIDNLHILADNMRERLPIISFYIDDLHYNLAVKLLNDLYGIQTRGGCSCAGTYGHLLLKVDQYYSKKITEKINKGDLTEKPGWIRASFHPTMTDEEVLFVLNSIKELAADFKKYEKDYNYNPKTNNFYHKSNDNYEKNLVNKWFGKE